MPASPDLLVALGILIAGLLLGALPFWMLSRARAQAALERGRTEGQVAHAALSERHTALEQECMVLRQRVQQLDTHLDEQRRQHGQAEQSRAQWEERASRIPVLERELAEARGQHEAGQQLLAQRQARIAELESTLAGEREQAQEKLALLVQAREQLADQFRALAGDILEEKSRRFAEQNQASLGALLTPLRDRLGEFQRKVEEVYVTEAQQRFSLQQEVKRLVEQNARLSRDADNLAQALKGQSKTQGTWGEMILERVLESSGLRKGVEYTVQSSFDREDGGRSQPDVVIQLPDGKQLVVDAKVTLTAYERYASTDDDAERQQELRRHLDSVRTHIKGLSGKNYHSLYDLKSLDFVLMFIPVEPAFMLAVTEDAELFDEAFRRNVLLVSPSTLLASLRTIANLWRQEYQNRNAQDIARHCASLYDKFVGFVEDIEDIGRKLESTQKAWKGARDKLSLGRGNLVRQVERVRELGVKPGKSLPQALVEQAGVDLDALPGTEDQESL